MSNVAASNRAVEAVLLRSRRRCALCYATGDDQPKAGNVVAVSPGATEAENLVFLCSQHHAEFDTPERRVSPQLVRVSRDRLYRDVEKESVSERDRPAVFVSAGHNEQLRKTVHSFLRGLNLEPIALQDRPFLGVSIAEKMERIPASYAIVILEPRGPSRSLRNQIFELGFLIGRLGRNRVFVLTESDVNLPSDAAGVPCAGVDAGEHWREALVRELASAGLAH